MEFQNRIGNREKTSKQSKYYVRGYSNLVIKKVFTVRFDEEVKKSIDKKDGIYSIIYYVYYMIMILLFGLFIFDTQIYDNFGKYFDNKAFFRFLFYIPLSIVTLLPIFIILNFRQQSIKSVGIKNEKVMKSILIGIIGSIPFSILNIIGPISSGKTLNPNILDNLWTFLYFLICIAFTEELVFRGFLQTRIQGLIKNKWISIFVVGIMFGLMHVPFQMIRANMSLMDFVLYDLSHLLTTCLIHIYLVYLYTRDNNIIAPTIAHAIINFSYAIFV